MKIQCRFSSRLWCRTGSSGMHFIIMVMKSLAWILNWGRWNYLRGVCINFESLEKSAKRALILALIWAFKLEFQLFLSFSAFFHFFMTKYNLASNGQKICYFSSSLILFRFFLIFFESKNLKLLKATGKNSKYEKISSLLISFLSHTQIIFLFNCCQSFKNHKKPKLSKKIHAK